MLNLPGPKPQTFEFDGQAYVIPTNVLCGDYVDEMASVIAEDLGVPASKLDDVAILRSLEQRQYLVAWLRTVVQPTPDLQTARRMYATINIFELQQLLVEASGIEFLGNSIGPARNNPQADSGTEAGPAGQSEKTSAKNTTGPPQLSVG